jgi:hypothetical protein
MTINGATLTAITTDSGTGGDFITNDNTLTLSGAYTISGGSTDFLGIWIDGVFLTAFKPTGGTWSFTDTTALSDGLHTISFSRGANAAQAQSNGANSVGTSHTLTVDTAAPSAPTITSITDDVSPATGTISSGGSSNDTTPTLAGTAEANSTVTIFDGTTQLGTTAANGSGAWSFTTAALSQGNHSFTATATDKAGNVSSASAAYTETIDTTALTITNIVVAGDDDLTRSEAQSGFSVTGNATGANGQTITVEIRDLADNHLVDSRTATVTSGSWTANFPGNEAISGTDSYSIHASVSDAAGNLGTADHAYTTDSTVCFMPGTRILTPEGETAVEALKAGDLVTTADGEATPIRWMGRQTVSRLFADPLRVLPIRITQGALGENMPSRDLLVSPDHALLVDGVLIQAGALVNGASIVRETNVPERFTYYHVELADHSLILAENTPAETFIDNIDRMAFDNWDEHEALADSAEVQLVEMSYPRAKAYRQVPRATRDRLARRAEALNGLSQVA